MKIKEICDKTGLTDRTVRYYIEEQLISPFYSENYLGRKSFDFSEQDLERLKDIATLRAFGFSVEEIKWLSNGEVESQQILETVQKRTGDLLEESRRRLNVLSTLNPSDKVDLSKLAQKISSAVPGIENETPKLNVRKRLISSVKYCAVFLAVWLPIISAVIVLVLKFSTIDIPIVRPVFFMYTLLCFLPSMITVLFFQRIKKAKKILRLFLMILCVLCLPLGVLFSSKSVTVCEHRYTTYSTIVEATCQHEGERLVRCEECGSFERQNIEKLPHTPEIKKGTPPTCTEAGVSDKSYCSVCETPIFEQTEISAKGHSYKSQVIEQSCGVDGCILYECACGESYRTNVVRATNMHDFQYKPLDMVFICSICGLEAVSYGNADGSIAGGNDLIKYYITGPVSEQPIPRTLVIYGSGNMPDFRWESTPGWLCSYMYEVNTVIIESGITSIGDLAFSNFYSGEGGCYAGVKKFIIRSKDIQISATPNGDDHRVSGIKCNITFDY